MPTLNEADTRAKLIDPAIHARGWTEDLIKREESAGAIYIVDGHAKKQSKGRLDYTLRIKVNFDTQPVAVALIEAKAEGLPPAHGLEQGKLYATSKRLNVPFVFSSNGHLFVEYDRYTGQTTAPRPIADFPTPGDLQRRYEAHMQFRLTDPEARPLLTRYTGGEATRRYYQDAAIRAVLEKVARSLNQGQPPRALLSLATGAGKTFIAVNLLKKIADAGQLRRALFICDRDELRLQATAAFQNVFGSDAAPVSAGKPEKNARIIIATYQTLDVDSDEADANFLTTHYPENYFSHIIIDECHRSAWGKWSQVFHRNPLAVQIGLTATPRQIQPTEKSREAEADQAINADNIKHFGEPVYEYDISQGIEDGYLAACEIVKGRVNLDDTGLTREDIMVRHPTNSLTGQAITREELDQLYERTDYEDRLLLPDRVLAMCQDLFNYLLATGGPEQKTIIFCVRDRHADDVAITLNNLYSAWCLENGRNRAEPFAFKCTAASNGSSFLPELKGSSAHHFIATTVDLLTTGVDVPAVRNIVFFKYVRSPISFYQMVGRGTRLDVTTGKLMFRIYDYTDATRLFGEEFKTKLSSPKKPPTGPGTDLGGEDDKEPVIQVEGFEVHVSPAGRYIVADVNGRAMPVTIEEYKAILAERLVQQVPNLQDFRSRWVNPTERHDLLAHLPEAGRSAFLIRELEQMQSYDLFDVLADLGYGLDPKTRRERAAAFSYKHSTWLSKMPPNAAATLQALVEQFATGGTDSLENQQIFQTPRVKNAGGIMALRSLGQPAEVLRETKERMFAA